MEYFDELPLFFRPFVPSSDKDTFTRVKTVMLPMRNENSSDYTTEAMLLLYNLEHLEEFCFVGSFYDDVYGGSCCLDLTLIKCELPDLRVVGSMH